MIYHEAKLQNILVCVQSKIEEELNFRVVTDDVKQNCESPCNMHFKFC